MSDGYAWIITHDYQADRNPQYGDTTGTYGPATLTPRQLEQAKRGEPFRLYDDSGRILATGKCACTDDALYAPLEEAGLEAADIRYPDHDHHGRWVSLG